MKSLAEILAADPETLTDEEQAAGLVYFAIEEMGLPRQKRAREFWLKALLASNDASEADEMFFIAHDRGML